MAKLNILQSLLPSLVSHDPSEIIHECWFDAQEICLIFSNIINQYYMLKMLIIFIVNILYK